MMFFLNQRNKTKCVKVIILVYWVTNVIFMHQEEDSVDGLVKDQVEHPVDKYDRTSSHDDNQKPQNGK